MSVQCPVCRTDNPADAFACLKCATPIDTRDTRGATQGATTEFDSASWRSSPVPVPDDPTGASWASSSAAPPSDWQLKRVQPGDVLGGRYEILAQLGEGGMGAVYRARDIELDRLVALKLIRPELANNSAVLRRFKQELILARQVTHRNVIRIYDLVLAEGRKFITMELVEGRDLMQLIVERRKFPPEEALDIFRQTLEGLQAAHREDVVHRDLKPHNIMVDANGRAYLMDFGIARSIESDAMTRTGVLMGTPDYMSPEQAKGEKADSRSDLFSMGVILFEMLTGVLPYQARTPMGTLLKRTQEEAPRVTNLDASVPEYVAGIVARCLAINARSRYQSAGQILADLSAREVREGVASTQHASASGPRLAAGERLGSRYVIEELLGEGGMGTVYKARDTELDRTVALKLVRPDLTSRASTMDRLKQELLLASRISHKHILRIHDLGEADGVKFISMAYVDGQDLSERLRDEGRLPLEQALRWAKQVCLALEAAHAEGIVHRDLKPQNVLIGGDGQACVADFGLATSLDAAAGGHDMMGTPRYMAPEQAETAAVDHRADIYSFGLILYEMVTGDVPFAGQTVMQTMFQRATQTPRDPRLLNPDLPASLAEAILQCIERDPARRFQSAREVLAALDAVSLAPTLPRSSTATKQLRFTMTAAALGLVVLAAVALVVPRTRNALLRRAGAVVTPQDVKHLAVLPIRINGDDPALALAADGLLETLNTRFSQLKGVQLSSPSAAAKVDQTQPLAATARALGAKLIFYGSGYSSNGKIDLIVSLSEPATGKRIWTHKFSGLPQDLLTIQDQIYNQLVAQLGIQVSSQELALGTARPTEDIGAYDLYLKGRNLLRGKRDEKTLSDALDLFEQASRRDGNFALAYTGIADASRHLYELNKDGKWATRALGAAERAQQLNDNLPEVHFALGSLYITTGKSSEAIAELRRALTLAPNSDEAYRRIGQAYMKTGQKSQAIAAFQKAVEVNPYYWSNHNLLGIAHVGAGDNDAALRDFQRVTQLDPGRSSGWENIGSVYHNQGKWQDSAAMFQKAVAIQPSADGYSNVGASLYFLGKCEDAKNYLEKAAGMSPDQYLIAGNLAQSYRCLGDKQQATKYYDRAITLALQSVQVNPKDASALAMLGLFYAENGDLSRGREFTRRARSVDAQDANVLYYQAAVYALAGEKTQALDGLKQAIAKGFSAKEAASDPDMRSLRSEPEFVRLTANS